MAWKVVDKKSITGGSARIIVADNGTAKPTKFADVFNVDSSLKTGFRDVGATDWGVSITRWYDKEDWEVDQVLWPIDEFITSWNMGLETSLAETDVENLKLVWNLAAETVDAVETPNEATLWINASWEISEKMILVQVDKRTVWGVLYKRLYVFYRAKYDWSDVTSAYEKGAKTLLPVKFGLLADTDEPVNTAFGVIIDQVYV